jgi:hypothetical protein
MNDISNEDEREYPFFPLFFFQRLPLARAADLWDLILLNKSTEQYCSDPWKRSGDDQE